MNDLPIEWFIRDDIKAEIDANLDNIARLAIKLSVDYVSNFNNLMDCIDTFVPTDRFTAEEISYAIEQVCICCSCQIMMAKGLLKRSADGYALTAKGRARYQKLKSVG